MNWRISERRTVNEIELDERLITSKAFREIPGNAARCYLFMRVRAGRNNVFTFSAEDAAQFGLSRETFNNYTRALERVGLIKADKRAGDMGRTLYSFSNDYLKKDG